MWLPLIPLTAYVAPFDSSHCHLVSSWCSALICLKNAPNIPAKNFHALTRLDENRAKCQVTIDLEYYLFL
jgi:hypothetical protein